jgi:hypothetical protein
MEPKQNAAKLQKSKSSSASGSYQEGRKRKDDDSGSDVDAVAAEEETPITMSGGSIIVEFTPDFDDDSTAGRKVRKARRDGIRFTRVVIRQGRGGPIINEFPPKGLELSRGCIIEIKGVR